MSTNNHSKPTATMAMVDKATAERWLKRSTRNRHISRQAVEQYARDMAKDQWQVTGEAIKFDVNGDVLDGQHRLMAVVLADVVVPMFVVNGLASESQNVMDSGRKRTAADALMLNGAANYVILAAAARVGLCYEAGELHNLPSTPPTKSNAEIVAYVNANPDLEDAATAPIYQTPCRSRGVLCFAYFWLHRIDDEMAEQFFGDIASMRLGGSGDPKTALVRRWTSSRTNNETIPQAVELHMIFRAWNAGRTNEPLRLIKVSAGQTMTHPIW